MRTQHQVPSRSSYSGQVILFRLLRISLPAKLWNNRACGSRQTPSVVVLFVISAKVRTVRPRSLMSPVHKIDSVGDLDERPLQEHTAQSHPPKFELSVSLFRLDSIPHSIHTLHSQCLVSIPKGYDAQSTFSHTAVFPSSLSQTSTRRSSLSRLRSDSSTTAPSFLANTYLSSTRKNTSP